VDFLLLSLIFHLAPKYLGGAAHFQGGSSPLVNPLMRQLQTHTQRCALLCPECFLIQPS
jgi:hypothetical protein